MLKRSLAASVMLACFAACAGRQHPASPEKMSADTAYLNGRIYTVNETQPWVEAVAINLCLSSDTVWSGSRSIVAHLNTFGEVRPFAPT